MGTALSRCLNLAVLLIAATALVAGCGKKNTPPSILPPGEGTWSPPAIVVSK